MQMRNLLRGIASLRFMYILVIFLLTPFVNAAVAPNRYDPVADPRAVVLAGSARFTILTPQLIRLEWANDRKFEDHASLAFVNRTLPVPQFTRQVGPGNRVVLKTSALTLVYDPGIPTASSRLTTLWFRSALTEKKSYGNRGRKTPAIFWAPPVRLILPAGE